MARFFIKEQSCNLLFIIQVVFTPATRESVPSFRIRSFLTSSRLEIERVFIEILFGFDIGVEVENCSGGIISFPKASVVHRRQKQDKYQKITKILNLFMVPSLNKHFIYYYYSF